MTSRPRGLAFQAFWLLAARLFGFAFAFALPLVVVRVLDQTSFGVYKQAFQLVMTIQAILTMGFGMSAFYFLPREPQRAPAVVWNIFLYHVMAGAFGCAVLLIRPDVLNLISGSGDLVRYATPVGLVLFTSIVSCFLEVIATARADVFWSTIFIGGSQLSRTLFLFGAAVLFRDIQGLLNAAILHGMLQTSVLVWYLLRSYPGCWRSFDRQMALEQLSYTLPLGAGGLLFTVQSDLHWLLVANRFSAAEFAIYSIGTTQVPLIGMLRDAVSSVILPRVSSLQHQGRHEEVLQVLLTAARKLALVYFPAFFCLMVIGRDFILTLFTARYSESWPIFAVNLLLILLAIPLTDAVTRAYSDYRILVLKFRIVLCVAQVIISLVCIHFFGMIGAVIALVVAYTGERAVVIAFVARLLGLGRQHMPYFAALGRIAAASAAAAGPALLVQLALPAATPMVRLIAAAAAYGLTYVLTTFLLNNLLDEEKELVNRYSSRYLRFRPFSVTVA